LDLAGFIFQVPILLSAASTLVATSAEIISTAHTPRPLTLGKRAAGHFQIPTSDPNMSRTTRTNNLTFTRNLSDPPPTA
jgi:hypothetical protein